MPKQNAYSLFLHECARRYPERLGPDGNMSFDALKFKFDHIWQEMTREEKDAYKKSAKDFNANPKLSVGGKPDWARAGVLDSAEKRGKTQREREFVEAMRREVGAAVDGFASRGRVASMRILVVEVNTWATLDERKTRRNRVGAAPAGAHVHAGHAPGGMARLVGDELLSSIPAEIAAVDFSLEGGVARTHLSLVHHGKIPLGYRNDMQDKSARRHKMEVDHDDSNPEGLETDHGVVAADLLDFLERARSAPYAMFPPAGPPVAGEVGADGGASAVRRIRRQPHIVFARPQSVPDVVQAWRWLCDRGCAAEDDLKVYDLAELLYETAQRLKQSVPPGGARAVCPSVSEASNVLDQLGHDYTDGVACREYHARPHMDCPNSAWRLARAKIQAFFFGEHLCPMVGVDLDQEAFLEPADGGKVDCEQKKATVISDLTSLSLDTTVMSTASAARTATDAPEDTDGDLDDTFATAVSDVVVPHLAAHRGGGCADPRRFAGVGRGSSGRF